MKEKLRIKGKISYELLDKDGKVKDSGDISNTITNYMDAHIADQMSGQSQSQIGFMAIGSGTGQTASSTDLANNVSLIPLSGTGPIQGTGADDNDVIYSAYWASGVGTSNISEAGIFQTSGTVRDSLCAYNDSLSINKGAEDTLKIDWTVTYGSS